MVSKLALLAQVQSAIADVRRNPRPHAAYWAQCEDCELRTRELEAAGCTRSDAQAVAEGEHMLANSRPLEVLP